MTETKVRNMANQDGVEGPKIVWTFPLLTRIQTGGRFLDLGNNVRQITENNQIGERIRGATQDTQEDSEVDSESDELGGLEQQIDEVREEGDFTFSQDEDISDTEVTIEDGVFIPTRANISEGDTITWTNVDDETHRISSINGEEFDSGQLEPGESFSHTFEDEGVTIYIDTMAGAQSMSGAVVVGDVVGPDTLPSEREEEPVPFSGSNNETKTMSEAADQKDNMDIGFSD